jgi:hypothetical protein
VVAFFSRTDIDNARNGEEVTTIRDSAIAHEGIKFGLPVKDTAFGKLCLDLFKDLDPNGTRKAVRLKWGKAVSSFPELDSNTWKRLEIDVYVGFSKVEKPGVMGLEIRLLALDGVHVEQKVGPVNEQLYEALKALPNVVDIDIDNTNLAFVQRLFQDIDSVPCVFIGNPEMEELIVYGFYKDFKATISFPTVSKCTLRVEGLV